MENSTTFEDIHDFSFSINGAHNPFVFSLLSTIYVVGLMMNLMIIILICTDNHLHNSMYLFLSNLSFVDLCFINAAIPNLIAVILFGNNSMSFMGCFIQMFLIYMLGSVEDLLLVIMAYDRYIAICKPLHYHSILTKRKCFQLLIIFWIIASLNSLLITYAALNMHFCKSNVIHQLVCDAKALTWIACSGTELIHIVFYVELLALGLLTSLSCLTSYIKILKVVLNIKSGQGRRKAFSTCSAHLTVITLYVGSGAALILTPSSKVSYVLDQVFMMLCVTVTPMLNPVIYSLRNKDIHSAGLRLLRVKPNQIDYLLSGRTPYT